MGGGPVVAGRAKLAKLADFEKERDGAVEGSRGWDDDTCDHAVLFGANGIISFGANVNVIWMWCGVAS